MLAQALDTLLAPAAGLAFRQSVKPSGLDRLVAKHAGAVGTAVHTFERCREAVDAASESLRWSGLHYSDLLDRSGPFALETLSNFGLGILRHSCSLREG